MNVSKKTIKTLVVIALIVVVAVAIAQISTARRTGKYLQDLASHEPADVMDAVAALRDRGPSVGPRLAEALRAGQGEAAPRAAWLLGLTGSHAGDAELLAALQSEDPVLRTAALKAAGQLRLDSAVQPVSAILADKEEKKEMRAAAATTLGAIGNETAVTALTAALAERPAPAPEVPEGVEAPEPPPDETIPVRLAATRALGRLQNASSIDALVLAAGKAEPDPEVRVAAAYALGDVAARATDETAATKAVQGLLDALEDEVGDVRIAAVYSLGKTSPPEALETAVSAAVRDAEQDDHYWTRQGAERTVELLRLPE